MDLIDEWRRNYDWIWTLRDHRMGGWFLMGSTKPLLSIITVYLVIVICGPRYMLRRQPFNLKWFMVVYNMAIATINFYICKELLFYTGHMRNNWLCQMVPILPHNEDMRIISALYFFGISKLIELLDTVFFILRKKKNQLTFLHVYHHSTMPIWCWTQGLWSPTSTCSIAAFMNAFIHVFMYSYYGLSVLGPRVAKYLWWKRYLTILQLIQFIIGMSIEIYLIFSGCPHSRIFRYFNVFYMLSYLFLFGRFYVSAYAKGHRKLQQRVTDDQEDQKYRHRLPSGDAPYRRVVANLATPASG